MTHNTAQIMECLTDITNAKVGLSDVADIAKNSLENSQTCYVDTSVSAANDKNFEGADVTPISDKINLTAVCNACFSGQEPAAPTQEVANNLTNTLETPGLS